MTIDCSAPALATQVQSAEETHSSHCMTCGQSVTWAHRPADARYNPGGWHAPLGYVGSALVVIQGVVYRMPTYEQHVCHPMDVERHRQRVELERETRRLRREQSPEVLEARAAQEQLDRIRNQESMRFACPDCHAPVDQMCWNLADLKKDRHSPVKHAHKARWLLALQANPDLGTEWGPT